MKLSRITTAAVFMLTAWLALPHVVGSQNSPSTPPAAAGGNTSETYRQLSLFGEVLERIRSDYVEEVQDRQLIEDAINGMLSSLDPHSSYMNARNYRDMQVQNRGEFGGLGIEVTMENGLVKVVSPIDDTPAARAGLRPNDLIIQLDGEQVQGLTLQEAVERMRGPINSQIKLMIRRGNQEPFEVTLTRAQIRIQSVRSRVEGDFGYVRITSFTEQTDVGLRNAITRIREQLGDRFKGLVLDLRNNPGGLLDQAIAVSDAFLERGEIVSTRGRRQEDAQRYNARPGDLIDGRPMIVLINGGSASASEIVAGALQDHRRAIILGTRSFGKGSVQTIMPLGNQGAIRLTTARYFTPSGRSIQGLGIDPDIAVEQARLQPIEQPRLRRESDLRGALSNPNRPEQAPPSPPQPNQPQQAPQPQSQDQQPAQPNPDEQAAAPAGDAQDYQLARALDLLRGLALYNARVAN
jgi:carboxyl-terminal processing protease